MTNRSLSARITSRAHRILDRVRNRERVAEQLITWALRRTGDIPQLSRGEA